MAPPVNEHGHPPDVTVLIVTKETDVINALSSSRETAARNVPLVSKAMNVRNALNGSVETVARNVLRITTELTVVMVLFVN